MKSASAVTDLDIYSKTGRTVAAGFEATCSIPRFYRPFFGIDMQEGANVQQERGDSWDLRIVLVKSSDLFFSHFATSCKVSVSATAVSKV